MNQYPYPSIPNPTLKSMSDQLVDGKTFGVRALAFLVDLGSLVGLSSLCEDLLPQLVSEVQPIVQKILHVDFAMGAFAQSSSFLFTFGLLWAYFVLFEALFGATPGKWILRMRVIRADGRPCGLLPALYRGLARLVDGLILGMVAALSMAAPLRQRLGDKWARTLVVSSQDPFIQSRRSFYFFILAFLLFYFLVFPLSQVGRLFVSIKAITPLIAEGAADFNLQVKDLGPGFSLSSDRMKDDSDDHLIFESSIRTFTSRSSVVSAQVVLASGLVSNISASQIRDILDENLRSKFGTDLETKGQRMTSLGKSSWALQYGDRKTGKDIIGMIVAYQNIFVQIALYGDPGEVDFDRAEALARLILDRAQSNYRAPAESNRISDSGRQQTSKLP